MRKFKNSNLSIYKGSDNPEENNSAMLSILGRVGFISCSFFILLICCLYPVSFDMCFMGLNNKLGGILIDYRHIFENILKDYGNYLYEQELIGQEQTVKEYFMRAFLEHREVVHFYHSERYFDLQATNVRLPFVRYSGCGIVLVVWFVYSLIGFVYVSLLAFFDFMFRKPVQNRGLSNYEEFVLDFVFKLPSRTLLVTVAMQLAEVLAYTFDSWMTM